MNKKRLSVMLALFVMIVIAGCSVLNHPDTSSDAPSTSADSDIPVASVNGEEGKGETAVPDSPPASPPLNLHFDKLQGDIRNIQYADKNQVFILAGKLYLYNLDSEQVVAETSRETFDQERVQTVKDGYAAVGMNISTGDDGGGMLATGSRMDFSAVFYDRSLKQRSIFHFNTLLKENEQILSLKAIALSADGTQAAYASNTGLYIYDFKTNQKKTIVDLTTENIESRAGIVTFEQIGFTNDDKMIAFKAQSFDIPAVDGKPSFDTCGIVNADGSGMSNRKFSNYTCKELTAYNKQLLFAEDFTNSSGRMMVMNVPGEETRIYPLKESKESGYIQGSDSGRYFATSLPDSNGWIIRIYNTSTGKLESEQRISTGGEARYMSIEPLIRIMDNTRTYMLLLGANQQEIQTKLVSSRF